MRTSLLFLVLSMTACDSAAGPDAGDAGARFDAPLADGGDQDAGVGTDAGTSDAGTSDAGSTPSLGCGHAPSTGFVDRTITIEGTERRYRLLVPEGTTGETPLPLVFVFHHRDGTSDAAISYGIQDAAASAGDRAIFLFPQALPYPGEGAVGWEIGCDRYDMAFASAIYDAVVSEQCVDTERVFATGFSWGADMTIAFGCCRHDIVRAIAPSSGTAWGSWRDACPGDAPAWRVTIGDADGFYPVADVQSNTDFFRARHGCTAETDPADPAPCVAHRGCDAPVIQCVYPGMGHQIPDGGAAAIWDFFQGF